MRLEAVKMFLHGGPQRLGVLNSWVRADVAGNGLIPQGYGIGASALVASAMFDGFQKGEFTDWRQVGWARLTCLQRETEKLAMVNMHRANKVTSVGIDQGRRTHRSGQPRVIEDERFDELWRSAKTNAIGEILAFIALATKGNDFILPGEDKHVVLAERNFRRIQDFMTREQFKEQRGLLSVFLTKIKEVFESDEGKRVSKECRAIAAQGVVGESDEHFRGALLSMLTTTLEQEVVNARSLTGRSGDYLSEEWIGGRNIGYEFAHIVMFGHR